MATQTAAEKKRWRLLRASAKAAAAEFAERDRAIAGMETKVAAYDSFEDEFMDALLDGGSEVEAEERQDAPLRHYFGLPRTRSSALYHNTPEYDTRKPCVDQHYSPRDTATGRCLECMKDGDRDRQWLAVHGINGSRHRGGRKAKATSKQSG